MKHEIDALRAGKNKATRQRDNWKRRAVLAIYLLRSQDGSPEWKKRRDDLLGEYDALTSSEKRGY